ncbi:DgyrCDS12397 [Dimorphilus gyrociliatus]|uniref:Tetraspanin n=1 Tax=Dimorphilus gyrociliatus TaxID=2664684 RepID=A0A7I8W6B1_9ANNE|nr:DgyrCDS12397 [Dimorphilus gyrociliatus]
MCKCSTKAFLLLFGTILWALAAALIWVSVQIFVEYRNIEELGKALYILVPTVVLILCAVLFFVVGLLGCIGSCKEHKCLLGTFCVCIIIIAVGLIVSASLSYHYRHKVEKSASKVLEKGLNHYKNNSIWRNEIDFIQEKFKCCGVNNATDWIDTPWGHHHPMEPYPKSCYKNETSELYLRKDGCVPKVKNFVVNHLDIILGTAFGFLGLLILGIIASCVLLCWRKKREEVPYVGLAPDGSQRV